MNVYLIQCLSTLPSPQRWSGQPRRLAIKNLNTQIITLKERRENDEQNSFCERRAADWCYTKIENIGCIAIRLAITYPLSQTPERPNDEHMNVSNWKLATRKLCVLLSHETTETGNENG